jgi:hypothetical protein
VPSIPFRPLAAAALGTVLAVLPAGAQEAEAPLTIRVRPLGTEAYDQTIDPDAALAARAAFEARVTARANRAIASVCTGCLAPAGVIEDFLARAP